MARQVVLAFVSDEEADKFAEEIKSTSSVIYQDGSETFADVGVVAVASYDWYPKGAQTKKLTDVKLPNAGIEQGGESNR